MKNRKDPVRFVLCSDRNLIVGLHITLFSLLKNLSVDRQCEVHIYSPDLTSNDELLLEKTAKAARPDAAFECKKLELPMYLEAARDLRGSKTPYARLFVHEHFGSGRIIYLDSDILVDKDLSELADMDLDGNVIAARVNGEAGGFFDRHFMCDLMGITPETPTFNSGVLVIDIDEWDRQQMSESVQAIIEQHGSQLVAHDQSVLNGVCAGKFARLDNSFNFQARMPRSAAVDGSEHRVYHFMGAPKPWDFAAPLVNGYTKMCFEIIDQTAIGGWRPYAKMDEIRKTGKNWKYFARYLVYGNSHDAPQKTAMH